MKIIVLFIFVQFYLYCFGDTKKFLYIDIRPGLQIASGFVMDFASGFRRHSNQDFMLAVNFCKMSLSRLTFLNASLVFKLIIDF